MARLRSDLAPPPPEDLISQAQLAALQDRIKRLHDSKLWEDAALWAVEDMISDYLEVKAEIGGAVTRDVCSTSPAVRSLHCLVAVSDGLASDAAFARQCKRKFL